MKRAILYARVSGDDRKNATSSIGGQLGECRKYAAQRGYRVVGEVFEEPDKPTSGADWLPELEKLVRLAPSGTFDVLICREVDRLARNRFKQLATEIELENHGVSVEYAVGQFEDNEEGRLLKGLVSEFAEYERGKIRRRTLNGKLRSVEAGNITIGGSVAPYGYDQVTTTAPATGKPRRVLVINEQEAAVVRQIFDLYARGATLYSVREWLDEHKVPLPSKGNNHRARSKGKAWSVGTIDSILNNETYIGRWHYRKTRFTKDPATGKARNIPRPREEWLEIPVPGIVSDETFETVQRRRDANKRQMGRRRKYDYPLGGMLTCGHCGIAMSGVAKTDGKGRVYRYLKCNAHHEPKKYGYRCDNAQFRADQVEAVVWGWIKSLLLEPSALRQALESYQQQQQERVRPTLSMLESSQARLGELEGRKERMIAAYASGVLSLNELATQKSALDKEIDNLNQAISALRAEAEPQLLSAKQIEGIEVMAAEIRAGVTAPIIGASKPSHLDDAAAAVTITLSPEDMAYLEEPYQPHRVLGHN